MKRFLKSSLLPIEILKIIFHFEPSYFWWSLPQVFISPLLSVLYVSAPKLILEKLTDGAPYAEILFTILIYCAILFLFRNINSFLSGKRSMAADRFAKKIRFEVGKITMRLDLSAVESPEQQDTILLAKNAERLVNSFSVFQEIISNSITIIALTILVIRLDILFLGAIALVLSIKILFSVWQYVCNKSVREKFAKNDRVGNYLQRLAYLDCGAQKELRINALQHWFMKKIRGYRAEMLHLQYRDFRRNAFFNIVLVLLTVTETLVVLVILIGKYMANLISIADFTMYFSVTTSLTTTLFSLTSDFEILSEQVLNLGDYRKLSILAGGGKERVDTEETKDLMPGNLLIEFKDVSFCYPGTNKLVLEHIDLKIRNHEKLVIVGLNGSGKTTLIKLLCKFYRPTAGAILLNGVDIWKIPNSHYYRQIGAVFQDFQTFAFSVRENISLNEAPDEKKSCRYSTN